MNSAEATERLRHLWDTYASQYDRDTDFYDRFLLGDGCSWVCSQATGNVLEVAIGTGRNLPFYARGTELTGIDFSAAMLTRARQRADERGLDVTLQQADAQHLPFGDGRFDTVVCTLALSSIPEPAQRSRRCTGYCEPAADCSSGHVASPYRLIRAGQRGLERLSLRLAGDYQTRQPYPLIVAAGFIIEERQRRRAGVIERLRASKPTGPN